MEGSFPRKKRDIEKRSSQETEEKKMLVVWEDVQSVKKGNVRKRGGKFGSLRYQGGGKRKRRVSGGKANSYRN